MENRIITGVCAALCLSLATPLHAAPVPKLSGIYIVTVQAVCPMTDTSQGAVASRLLRAAYSSVHGTVTVTGSMTYSTLGNSAGTATIPVSYSSAFSNTTTTLTDSPNGSPVTVAIMYGALVGDIAQSYFTSGPVSEGSLQCIETAQGVRQ